jgi:hypothetical protein
MPKRVVRRGQSVSIDLNRAAKIIRGLLKREKLLARETIDVADEIGEWLTKVKNRPDMHGKWLPWLQNNFGMSEASAQRRMSLHGFLAANKSRNVRDLDLSLTVFYFLAGRYTPPEVIREVIERAQAGEPITLKVVRELPVQVRVERRTDTLTAYVPRDPNPKPERRTVAVPNYVEPPRRQLPAPEPAEPVGAEAAAAAFFDALAAIDLPLPDARVLATAFRAQAKLSPANVREVADALNKLLAPYLLATSPETPPGGWQH